MSEQIQQQIQQQIQRPRVPVLDMMRLSLYASHPELDGVRCRLAWCFREGFPRLVVYFNNPNIRGYDGSIIAPFDIVNFNTFITKLKEVALSTSEVTTKVECNNAEWRDGKAIPNSRILQAVVEFGKDKDGVIWISLKDNNKSIVKFNIIDEMWVVFYKPDGNQIPKSDASKFYTLSLISILEKIMVGLFSRHVISSSNSRQLLEEDHVNKVPELTRKELLVDNTFDDDVSF